MQLRGSCLLSNFWRIATSRVLHGLTLLQAIGESQFAGFCVVSSYWGVSTCRVLFCLGITISSLLSCVKLLGGYNLQGLASRQTVGELQFARFCVVSSYWGLPTCSVILPQVIGNAPVFCQANGEFQFAGLVVHQAFGELQFARSCFALISWGITDCTGDSVIFLKHAKSLADCGSSYILNTPLHAAIPVHQNIS